MITYAYLHKDEVSKKLAAFSATEESKWFNPGNYIDFNREIKCDTYTKLQLAAIHNNAVQGYFSANFDRETMVVHSLAICKFCSGHELEFAADLTKIFNWLRSEWRLIRYYAFVGSPTESVYERIAHASDGGAVGRFKHYGKLIDGMTYDAVFFEVSGTATPQGRTLLPKSFAE